MGKWEWYYLSLNETIPFTISFLEEFESKWNWDVLSQNKKLPWNEDLIEKFKDKWYWGTLGSNKSIKWTIDMLDRFKDKLQWNPIKISDPWRKDAFEKYLQTKNIGYLIDNDETWRQNFKISFLTDDLIEAALL